MPRKTISGFLAWLMLATAALAAAPPIPPSAPPSFATTIPKVATFAAPISILPVGDSKTIVSSDPSGMYFGAGPFEVAIGLNQGRYMQVGNAGVSGQNSTQEWAAFPTMVLPKRADLVANQIGTNDFIFGMTGAQIATLFQNIERGILAVQAYGGKTAVVVPSTKNGASLAARNAVPYYYDLAAYYHLPLMNNFTPTVSAVTGNFNPAYSDDGTHENAAGIAVIAPLMAAVLANPQQGIAAPYIAAVSETTAGVAANLLRNGSFAKQTIPGVPDGWSINITGASYTLPAATYPLAGNTFKYVKVSSGLAFMLFAGGITTGFSVGDTLMFTASVKISGLPSPATGLTIQIDGGASFNYRPMFNYNQAGDVIINQKLPPIPSGVTSLTVKAYATDVGTYEIGGITLTNLTARQAIYRPGQLP